MKEDNIKNIAESILSAKEEMLQVEIKNLTKNNSALSETIDRLVKALEDREQEIAQLKSMINSAMSGVTEIRPLIISDEELIADVQLRKLKEDAMARPLTLDEIKKYDLLIKNKRLAQGAATVIEDKGLPKDLSKNKLLELASGSIKKD